MRLRTLPTGIAPPQSAPLSAAEAAARQQRDALAAIQRSGIVVNAFFHRETEEALRVRTQDLTARARRFRTQLGYLRRLLAFTHIGGDDGLLLPVLAERLEDAWEAFGASPASDETARQVVDWADRFAREVVRLSQGVDHLGRDVDVEVGRSLREILKLLGDIDDINKGLAVGERADLVRALNEQIGVRTITRPDGRVLVFTSSGFALLDSQPAIISAKGGEVIAGVGRSSEIVSQHFATGRLGGLLEMRTADLAMPENGGAVRLVRKLRAQFDALANGFLGPSKDDDPPGFAEAYGAPNPKAGFFVGRNRLSFSVNPALIADPTKLRRDAAPKVAKAIAATGRNCGADGLNVADATYAGIAAAIIEGISTMVQDVKKSLEFAETFHSLLVDRHKAPDDIGIDHEISVLQELQNSASSSTRIKLMTETMENVLGGVVQ